MKIFHTSDWHLGRMLYGRSLLADQTFFIEQVFMPQIEEESPDLIIIAGDIYDRPIAPTEAIELFDRFLTAMARKKIPVAVIAGNHDSAERMAIGKEMLRQNGIYIATNLDDAQIPLELEKDGEKLQVFLLPYLDTAVVRDYFHDDSLRGESACMLRTIELLKDKFDEDCTKLLVSHCFAAGALTSDSESGLWVGGSGAVSPDIWRDFDYVALGHLHRAQKSGERARYAGSPLTYSVDEQHHHKSFVKLKLSKGIFTHELIPVKPLRAVRRISGEFEDLIEEGKPFLQQNLKPIEDYVELELLDQKPILLAAERLREYYPNLLAVTNRWVAEAASQQRENQNKKQDDLTIFKSFLSDICHVEFGEEEEAWFRSVRKNWENREVERQ